MQEILGLVRRCVEDYDMIQAGDTVAVGVSGGKDSWLLAMLMKHLQPFSEVPFASDICEATVRCQISS